MPPWSLTAASIDCRSSGRAAVTTAPEGAPVCGLQAGSGGTGGGGVRGGCTGGGGVRGGFGGSHTRQCTQRAVHAQGGAHKRRPVATVGVLLFKGPRARRYTQKAVHTQGGAHKRRSVATAGVLLFKGLQARRYTQKAVHTEGGAHTLRCTPHAVRSCRSLVI